MSACWPWINVDILNSEEVRAWFILSIKRIQVITWSGKDCLFQIPPVVNYNILHSAKLRQKWEIKWKHTDIILLKISAQYMNIRLSKVSVGASEMAQLVKVITKQT